MKRIGVESKGSSPKRRDIVIGTSSSNAAASTADHEDRDDDEPDETNAGMELASTAASPAARSTPAKDEDDNEEANPEAVAKAYLRLENEVYSTQLRPFDAYSTTSIENLLKEGDTFKYRRQVQVAMFEVAARFGVVLKCKKMSTTRVAMCSSREGEEFVLGACFARRRLGTKKKSRGGQVVANGNPWKITKVSIGTNILNGQHEPIDTKNKKNIPFNTEILASVLLGVAGGRQPVAASVIKEMLSVYVPPGTIFTQAFISAVRKRAQRLIADRAINQAISHALKQSENGTESAAASGSRVAASSSGLVGTLADEQVVAQQRPERVVRLALVGLGAVNSGLCDLLRTHTDGRLQVCAVSDSSGALIIDNPGGEANSSYFPAEILAAIIRAKSTGIHVADMQEDDLHADAARWGGSLGLHMQPPAAQQLNASASTMAALMSNGVPGGGQIGPRTFNVRRIEAVNSCLEVAQHVDFDVLVESSPSNLQDGQPGLGCAQHALKRGKNVVFANKAPLVLAYDELMQLSRTHGGEIRFSATVCGGLPVVNVGQRDLVRSRFSLVEGVFNSTSNFVLTEVATGSTRKRALKEAQKRGIAEADSSKDLEGWDTASKLVIIVNAVLGVPAKMDHVDVTGIDAISDAQIHSAIMSNKRWKLVARATKVNPSTIGIINDDEDALGYKLSVQPELVEASSFLGGCVDTEMCIRLQSDLFENITMKTDEKGTVPTCAAVLRDCWWVAERIVREEPRNVDDEEAPAGIPEL